MQMINVLLVDDDAADRRLVNLMLTESPQPVRFAVETAEYLAEALKCLKSHSFDVVLLDLGLPDSRGLETVDNVCEACPHIPVVVLTGLADENVGFEAIKRRASDYLVKGKFSGDMLVRAIQYSLERKRAEEELRKHREHLEVMVKERTADLEKINEELQEEIRERKQVEKQLKQAKQQAEAANKAKSEFLANMSHELRTPLHSILSFAGFGTKKYATAKPEKLLDYFDRIHHSGETLLSLVNDLLNLAKLESGKMDFDFQPTNLSKLINSVADEFSSLASESNLTIRCETSNFNQQVTLDAEKIKQVLRNLLSNAVKFSPEFGTVEVAVCRANDSIRISVRDQGTGIPKDELAVVFDKFAQSSKTKTGAGGTGLGLAVCQQIINAHKGRIWAENNPDGGAVFLFEIPLSLTHHAAELVAVGVDNDLTT